MLYISKSSYDLHEYIIFFRIMKKLCKRALTKKIFFFLSKLLNWRPDLWLKAKKGEIYLSPWNHDKWMSPQKTHKVEYVSIFLKQTMSLCSKQSKFTFGSDYTKKYTIMPFVGANSHLTTKPHNVNINYQSKSES